MTKSIINNRIYYSRNIIPLKLINNLKNKLIVKKLKKTKMF